MSLPRGAFRTVILAGAYAVKVPRIRLLAVGMRCNRWEREVWRTWRLKVGWDFLCPIVFADPFGLIVVMRRAAQPVTEAEVESTRAADWHPQVTCEHKVEDWGRIGPGIVVLDYCDLTTEEDVRERRAYYAKTRPVRP